MKKITNIIIMLAILFTVFVTIYVGLGGLLLGVLSPYVILWIVNKLGKKEPKKDISVLITTILISCFGIFFLTLCFIHPDYDQNFLVFIGIPIYQLVATVIGSITAIFLYNLKIMEKKKSLVITLFLIPILIEAIRSLIVFIFLCITHYEPVSLIIIPTILKLSLCICSIGVLKLKKWAYYSLLVISGLYLLITLLYFLRGINVHFSHIISPTTLIKLIYFIILICYFVRPKIKEHLTQRH